MAYDVFQSRGPSVSLSLFGDAATQGTNIGKAVPSITSSIIQGAKEGVTFAQDYETQSIQNENNAAIAEQNRIKAENAQRDADLKYQQEQAALKKAQAEAEIKQYELETQKLTQETDTQLAVLEKKNKYLEEQQRAKKLQKITTQEAEISEIMREGSINPLTNKPYTDEEKAKVYIGGKYADYWEANKKEQEQGIMVYRPYYKGQDKETAEYFIFPQERTLEANRALERLKNEGKVSKDGEAFLDLVSDGGMANALDQIKGVDPSADKSKMLSMGKIAPAGQYVSVKQADGSYRLQRNPDYMAQVGTDLTLGGTKTPDYDFFYKGQKIPIPIKEDDYNKFTRASAYLSNTYPEIYKYGDSARTIYEPDPGPTTVTSRFSGERPVAAGPNPTSVSAPQTPAATATPSNNAGSNDLMSKERQKLTDSINANPNLSPEQKQDAISRIKAPVSSTPTTTTTPINPREIRPLNEGTATATPEVTPAVIAKKVSQSEDSVKTIIKSVNKEPLLKSADPLIKAVAAVESGGDREAVSPTNVKGLLQVTKPIAEAMGVRYNEGVPFDRDIPEENVQAGTFFINELIRTYDGNRGLALGAYNGGEPVINYAIGEVGSRDWRKIKTYIKDVLPYENPEILTIGREFKTEAAQRKAALSKAKEIAEYPDKVLAFFPAFNKKDSIIMDEPDDIITAEA